MLRSRAAAAALLLLAGCHLMLPGGERCSARGGPEWRAYRSRHFVVLTDLDRGVAATLVADLERIQALVTVALTGEQREIPGYVRVVVPARRETFRGIAPFASLAYFRIDDLGEPTIVLDPEALRHDPEVVAHELAHHWTWYFFPRQPLWFTEGVAQFVQTVASDTPGYRNAVGVVPRVRAGSLRLADQVPARALLSRGVRAYDPGLYQLWSWVLYHWLWNERPKQLAEFQRRLGATEDPSAAWVGAFPELDPENGAALRKLDAALDDHRRNGEFVFYQVTAKSDGAFTDAPLPPADVHVLLSGTKRELEAALADDPLDPVALYKLTKKGDADRLRAATAARPDDWRAWYLLGVQIDVDGADPAEREAAYRKAIALNPGSASAHNALAWSLVSRGRAEEALPFARRAVELAPANAAILDTLAKVAGDLGACEEALRLQKRAVALAPERMADELGTHLRDIEKRCAAR